ncbi:flagellar protein FliT [Salinicola endophyticus]|uniref:Flagellar protein FliT n=1 Tax=Salinicola endophyticus TaxID=1949083 RepID=A0ABY8FJR2_9GAMM|nr:MULTISPECIES: flagellar protein FliT [Salinicola]WFF42777.1 flagellar protein FliT [Salinicola endophyticus]
MTEHESVVARYRELLEVSNVMLGYARSQDWEALIQQEARYAVELDRVRLIGDQGGLSESERQDQLQLLEQILSQDAETRRLLDARRDELAQMIGNSRRQQAVGQAYQGGRGGISTRLRFNAPDGGM